jgi:WD40 repeat protein
MKDVFISYSRRNKDFVQRVFQALEKHNIDAWVDWEDIPLTSDWMEEIRKGIEDSSAFVFIISPDSVRSEVCSEEVAYAVANNKRFIPVLYENVVEDADKERIHPMISSHNWLFFRDEDNFDKALSSLITALDTDLDYVRHHTRLLIRAREWDSKGRKNGFVLSGAELREAEAWFASSVTKQPRPTELHMAYLTASRKVAAGRQRKVLLSVTLALVISVILGIFAITQSIIAEQSRVQAVRNEQISLVRQLAAQSSQRLDRENLDLDLALLLSVEAENVAANLNTGSLPGVSSVLFDAIEFNPLSGTFLHGHTQKVDNMAFSPNGSYLASIDQDGTVFLWNTATRSPIVTIDGQRHGIRSVAFSPDSSVLATGSWDGILTLWDTTSGTQKTQIQAEGQRGIQTMTFSPDGKYLVEASWGGFMALWDIHAGSLIASINAHTDEVRSLIFNDDGTAFASGSKDGTVRVWHTTDGAPLMTFDAGEPVTSVDLSPDNTLLVAGTDYGQVYLWDTTNGGQIITILDNYERGLEIVTFNPTGSTLAAASWDGAMTLWDVASKRTLARVGGRENLISTVAFSPDASMLVSGNVNGSVTLRNARSGGVFATLSGHNDLVSNITFSDDAKQMASASWDGSVLLWRLIPDNSADSVHSDIVSTVAFSPTQPLGASASFDHTIRLWNTETHQLVAMLKGHNSGVNTVSFSPDGSKVVSGGWDGVVNVWDTASHQALLTLNGNQTSILSAIFSPDSSKIASAGWNGSVILWDAVSGQQITTIDDHERAVKTLVFSPDGNMIATGGNEGVVRVWDVDTGALKHELSGHSGGVNIIALSPDGSTLASASWDGNAILWNVENGAQIGVLPHDGAISSIAFSSNHRLVTAGSWDGTMMLWDTQNAHLLGTFTGHSGGVNAIAFSPDNLLLASGGWDHNVILWDADSTDAIATFTGHTAGVNAISFSADGGSLISGGDDGQVLFWRVSRSAWRDEACRIANRNLTSDEWQRFLGNTPYHETCPALN